MLQVSYKGKFLHLAAGSQIEIEKSSPLFLIDSLLAEYTMPITLTYNEHNARILGEVFFEYGIKQKQKLEVVLYDSSTQIGSAVLVIDKSLTNSTNRTKGNVQGFFLTGSSEFLSKVKNKKLNSLFLGGSQSFDFTTWDAFDSSDGFWQHVHATWDGTYNYVMIPHRNDAWIDGDFYDGWVNQLGEGYKAGIPQFPPGQVEATSWIVLWPKLKYVLEQLFTENGWKIDTTGIGESDWHKLYLYNPTPIRTTRADDTATVVPIPQISISVSDMISPEIYCSDFLLWVCKRYGWAPIFDADTKTCRIISLRSSGAGTVKDFTKYAPAFADSDFSSDPRVFAFINKLPENDAYLSQPDFTNYTIQPPVANFASLPPASVNYDTSLVFCYLENAFYKIDIDNDGARQWVKHADNVYNEEPADYTDQIETGLSTMPGQLSAYRETSTGVKFYGIFPICQQPRNKEWGLRAIFYHGMVLEQNAAGGPGTLTYPYASPVAKLPDGSSAGSWSNVYKHSNGTLEDGIIKFWWEDWLRYIQVPQQVEQELHLPLHELSQLKWDDIINIRNQPFLIKKYIQPIPYNEMIKCTLQPLLLNDVEAVVVPDPDAPAIYLSIAIENITSPTSPYWDDYLLGEVVVRAFSNAAGTIPYNANGLMIKAYAEINAVGISITNQPTETFVLTGAVTVLKPYMKQGTTPGTTLQYIMNYFLEPMPTYNIL